MLPIFDVALAGIDRMVRRLPCLLSIYWVPWLLGTIVLVILEVVVQDQLRLGRAPRLGAEHRVGAVRGDDVSDAAAMGPPR